MFRQKPAGQPMQTPAEKPVTLDPREAADLRAMGKQRLSAYLAEEWKPNKLSASVHRQCSTIVMKRLNHDFGGTFVDNVLVRIGRGEIDLNELPAAEKGSDDRNLDRFISDLYISSISIGQCLEHAGHLDPQIWSLWEVNAPQAPFVLLDIFISRNLHKIINYKYMNRLFWGVGMEAAPSLFTLMCQTDTDPVLREHAQEILPYKFLYADKNVQIDFDEYKDYEDFIKKERSKFTRPPEELSSTLTAEKTRQGYRDALLASVSVELSPEDQLAALTALNREVRLSLADRVEPALNAVIRKMPSDNLEQKKAICDFVEKTLEPLGLAVKAPNTPGLPGKLKATTGHWPGVGRFHFEVYIDGKQKKPAASDTLPELTLIDAAPAVETETHWQEKVGPKTVRPGRKLS